MQPSLFRPVDYMEPGNIDYSLIEPGMRSLVRKMNGIPFLKTVSSCEGHMQELLFGKFKPDAGHVFLDGGHIAFDMDTGDARSAEFVKDVVELTGRFKFAVLDEVSFGPEHVHMIRFNTTFLGGFRSDLAKNANEADSDSEEIRWRNRYQIDLASAQQRKQEYDLFWKELEAIATKYSESK